MGTFHSGKGHLHGITVVVDTKGPRVYIGRCWEMDDRRIVLVDVDEHADGQDGRSKRDFIRQAAKVGVWKKHERVVLAHEQVDSVAPLGAIRADRDEP
ncbi:MAG: hypothetical protein PVJ43_02135 [Gemmatimonadales bacterium]|jgi:hypothetical protein